MRLQRFSMKTYGSVRRMSQAAAALLLSLLVWVPSASSQTPSRRDDLVFIFDNLRVWTFIDGVYTQLHPTSPGQIAVADFDGNGLDDIACEFGPALWTFYDNSFWFREHLEADVGFPITLLTLADVGISGRLDYVIDDHHFTFAVIPRSFSNWITITDRIDTLSAVAGHINHPLTSPGDDLILNYNDGVWIRSIYLGQIVQLHPHSAQAMALADFDAAGKPGHNLEDLVIGFADGLGTWIYRTNLAWIQVHPLSAVQMAAGDLDGSGVADLVLDFGPGYGIWIYNNLTSWRLLHPSQSRHIVLADLDGNGVKDIIVDFGPDAGIWVFQNNLSWYQLTALSAKQIVRAHLK